jgi:hypothetical protein
MTDLDQACIFLRDELSSASMTAVAGHGVRSADIGRTFPLVDGAAGQVLITGRPVLVADYHGFPRRLDTSTETKAPRSIASVPISWGGRLRGALSAGSSDPSRTIGSRELGILSEVAELGAVALEHADTRQQLERALEATVEVLAKAVEVRDRRTGEQVEQVVRLAGDVGQELGLDTSALVELEMAALLHDVGKIGVPDSILLKPGPLNAREWDVMKRHPEWGAEMLGHIPGLEGVAGIVLHHHERWGGGGYPSGLRGERIPLASRIVCVCDAYQAMILDRPYRPALRPISALHELQSNSGSHFDPQPVAALTAVARVAA